MARNMMDIGLNDDEDIYLVSGDFPVIECTAQHQQQILLNTKGDFKESPTVCVGAFSYLDDENYSGLIRAVNVEFSRDGMEVRDVRLTPEGNINSNAVYK